MFLVIASESPNAQNILKEVLAYCTTQNINTTIDQSALGLEGIIVVGGDGYMLRSLHSLHHLKIPFFGINAGKVGFLMNEKTAFSLIKDFSNLPKVKLYPLEMKAMNSKGRQFIQLAFNDIAVSRSTSQAAKLSIEINKKLQMEELIADGLIVSTPGGSSAYNLSAGGRVVPIESKLICLTPICTFRPRRWQGAIIPDTCVINIHSLENNKRPVGVVADFWEVHDIVSVEIRQNAEIEVEVIFSSPEYMDEKMIKEQFII